jgi:hypothetical protein
MATKPVLDTAGIGDLLRDLRKIDKRLGASLVSELRAVGDKARDQVRGSTAPPYRTGRLRGSVKTGVRRGSISLYSNMPQAPVWHWGGSIEPRGVPIRFPRTEFVSKEVLKVGAHAEGELAAVLDATAARYQFH